MQFANVLKDTLVTHLWDVLQDQSNQLLKNPLIPAIHRLVGLIQTALLDMEILLAVLVNQDMLVCLQIADQNVLPIQNVQAI